MKSTPVDRRKAAWFFGEFTVSKTVPLQKAHVGLTPDPRQRHPGRNLYRTGAEAGGLVDFYSSPALVAWTPTGTNEPDYPKLAQPWREYIGEAVSREATPVQTATATWPASRTPSWSALPDPAPKENVSGV